MRNDNSPGDGRSGGGFEESSAETTLLVRTCDEEGKETNWKKDAEQEAQRKPEEAAEKHIGEHMSEKGLGDGDTRQRNEWKIRNGDPWTGKIWREKYTYKQIYKYMKERVGD